MDKKVSAFFVGNLVGLTILVGGVLLTLPQKLKETETIEKQELARKDQSAKTTAAAEPTKIEDKQDSKVRVQKAEALAPYVVASKNIIRGEKIVSADVTLEKLPLEENQDALTDLENAVGKTTTADILKGSTITTKVLK
jgi:flagella basal body P-ring formation protein FlgA